MGRTGFGTVVCMLLVESNTEMLIYQLLECS